jgi:predicted ATP-dependent serine protease
MPDPSALDLLQKIVGNGVDLRPPSDEWRDDQRGDSYEGPLAGDRRTATDRKEDKPPEPPLQLDEINAADLVNSGPEPELDFLPLLGQNGYIVRGWSHLIAASPRLGKTELLAECCAEWSAAGERILFFTEEPRAIWKWRLSQLPGPWTGLQLVFALGAANLDLVVRMRDGQETIAIFDTIRNLGLLPPDENDNSAIAKSLGIVVSAARRSSKTLIFVHHNRKGGGEHGEGIAGGHALLGTVDIALEVRRDTAPNRRAVKGYARIIQPQELLYERGNNGRLQPLGDPAAVGLMEARHRVLRVLGTGWMKTSEVMEQLEPPKPSQETVRKALTLEVKEGRIERDPPLLEGPQRGKTPKWRIKPEFQLPPIGG